MELTDEDIAADIPDVEHVELVLDGVIDTVAGTEGLTHAQRYLAGTLYASGMVSYSQYHGNEGVIDVIKDGLKKAWEYVVKMFKQIWGFFFKSKAKGDVDATQKALAALEKSARYHPSSANARPYVRELIKAGAKISHMSTGANDHGQTQKETSELLNQAREKEKELKDATPTEEAKIVKEIETVVNEVMAGRLRFIAPIRADSLEKDIKQIEQRVKELKRAGENVREYLESEISWTSGLMHGSNAIINGLKGYVPVLREFTSLDQALHFASKSRSCVTAIGYSFGDFTKSRELLEKKIGFIESSLKEDIDDHTRRGLKLALDELKSVMICVGTIVSVVEKWLNRIKESAESITIPAV